MIHLASSREGSNAVVSPSQQENTMKKSPPVSSAKDRSNNNRTEKPDQSVSAPVKNRADKKDVKSERKMDKNDSVNYQKTLNANGNVLSDSVNSRLVDAYHIPDASQHVHGHKQDGFRGGKLDTDNNYGKQLSKFTKVESSINGKSELHYSSATDLSQPQPYTANGNINGTKNLKKKTVLGVPRSASSSSSREESDPKSWSEKFEKLMEKEKSEVRQSFFFL